MTTTHEYRGYVFTIEYRPEDPAYTVSFADFTDIITSGDTLAEAFANACEALDLHLESLKSSPFQFPPPNIGSWSNRRDSGDDRRCCRYSQMMSLVSRIAALLIAIGYFIAMIVAEHGITKGSLAGGALLLLPLALIWFPEQLGSFTGYVGRGGDIDTETPPGLVSRRWAGFFCWATPC